MKYMMMFEQGAERNFLEGSFCYADSSRFVIQTKVEKPPACYFGSDPHLQKNCTGKINLMYLR